MSLEIEHIKKAIRENSDPWYAHHRVESLASNEPEGTLGDVLWEGVRTETLKLGGLDDFWGSLSEGSRPLSAQDLLIFFEDVAARQPDGPHRHSAQPPGWNYALESILDKALSFDGVAEELVKHWNTLPAPYCDALSYCLAMHKLIAVHELADHLLPEYAHMWLEELDDFWSRQPVPWPDKVWRKALAKAAISQHTRHIKSWHLIEMLAASAEPEHVIKAFSKLCRLTHEEFPQIAYFRDHAKTYITPFEDYIATLDVTALPEEGGYEDPAPLMHLSLGYLACCQALDKPPKQSAYLLFEHFYHGHKVRWSGGEFLAYFKTLNRYLAHIPRDIAEAIFLSSPTFQWLFAPSAPTPDVYQAVAQKFRDAIPTHIHDYESHAQTCLAMMGADIVPYCVKALIKNKRPMRRQLIHFLSDYVEREDVVKVLVGALGDSAKGNREAAQRALLKAPLELVFKHMGDALDARAKGTREMAAQTLVTLQATEQGYALAQARLDVERVQSVRDILERVHIDESRHEVSAADEARIKEAVVWIQQSDGKSWREFLGLGDHLIHVFMRIWADDAGTGTVSFYFFDEYDTLANAWVAMLAHLGAEHEGALHAALYLAGAVSDHDYEEYFQRLDAIYGKKTVGEKLVTLVSNDQFIRPPDFEPCSYHHPRKEIISHIFKAYQEQSGRLVPSLLQDKLKTPRARALAHIKAHPETVAADHILPLLKHTHKAVREAAAQALAITGTLEHLEDLKTIKGSEKARPTMLAMELAIARIASRHFSLEDFAHTGEGQKKLDQALGELDHIPVHRILTRHVDQLTAPTWTQLDQPMSKDAFEWLLGESIMESFDHHSSLLRGVCAQLKAEDVHQLCEDLIEKCASNRISGWSLFMQSTLAGEERLYKTGTLLEDFAKSQSFGWGDHGVIMFERVNSELAVRILDDWSRKSRRDALKWRAAEAVERMAHARGVSVEELTEMVIPDVDFDARGERRFDYGPRVICMKLSLGDTFEFTDEASGRSFKHMPKARVTDDAALVKRAHADVSLIKKELKRLRRVQQNRFQEAMVSGRRWELELWRSRYALNPVMRSFAQGVLWGIFDEKTHRLEQAVIVDQSADLVGLDDEVVTLNETTSRLGVVHPCMLSAPDRHSWIENFAEYEIIESFPQLTRDVYFAKDWPNISTTLCTKFRGLHPLTFMGRADRIGWEKGAREDAGLVHSTGRQMGDYSVVLSHDGYSPDYVDDSQTLYITNIQITDAEDQPVELGNLPAHIFSEIVYSLMHITGGLVEGA